VTGFETFIPEFGKVQPEQTIVYMVYDQENLYFGFRCFDDQPEKIKAAVSGRLNRDESLGELSLTGKYGITPSLILDGTINPDFSQVEADAGQVDVNLRYDLFLWPDHAHEREQHHSGSGYLLHQNFPGTTFSDRGTVIQLGYGSLYNRIEWQQDRYVESDRFLETRRGLFFKVSYLWRL